MLALGDLLVEHPDALGVSVVDPRVRSRRNHIYVLQLPVERCADFFARNDERVSPERGGIRVSLAMFNTADDIERLVEVNQTGLRTITQPAATEASD
ncbi:hypothetical protein CR51_41870 [Caballeronia megalochromosomata]|nr:hypothetical protein CR51_41870 [Caballeronia megalochromosomata]